jgi:hypothetical protein
MYVIFLSGRVGMLKVVRVELDADVGYLNQ